MLAGSSFFFLAMSPMTLRSNSGLDGSTDSASPDSEVSDIVFRLDVSQILKSLDPHPQILTSQDPLVWYPKPRPGQRERDILAKHGSARQIARGRQSDGAARARSRPPVP